MYTKKLSNLRQQAKLFIEKNCSKEYILFDPKNDEDLDRYTVPTVLRLGKYSGYSEYAIYKIAPSKDLTSIEVFGIEIQEDDLGTFDLDNLSVVDLCSLADKLKTYLKG